MLSNRSSILLFSAICVIAFVASQISASPQRPGGGFGGPNSPDVKLVDKYDADGDGILNTEERAKARVEIKKLAASGGGRRRGPGGRGGRRGGGANLTPQPGPKVAVADAKSFPDAELYDRNVVRTFFLEFEADDWEQELAEFKPTDVEIPAKLTVDGKTYPNVGLSFRGASSFFMIPPGMKRSLSFSMDFMDSDQRLYGYKSLNLLNCNGDATMMSTALYSTIARKRIAAPKSNFVKVVINGESWGLYANVQQFDKIFLEENYGTKKGSRWKVHGSPQGDGGLRYLGDEIDDYRTRYEIKSKDTDEAWNQLLALCKTLDETPTDQLEEKLSPILDIDGALWFLAVDVATVNSDGYWTRASDYNIYLDDAGMFHILPHDMNESFRGAKAGLGGGAKAGPGAGNEDPGPGGVFDLLFGPPRGGPGGGPPGRGRGGGGHGSIDLEPMVQANSERFQLRNKLLGVEKFKKRYLQYLRLIAEESFDEKSFGEHVANMRDLIKDEVAADTKKLMTVQAFETATNTSDDGPSNSLIGFAKQRSEFLLNHPDIKNLPKEELPPVVGKTKSDTKVSVDSLKPSTDSSMTVVINEVMASNSKTKADANGDFDDWIELYNRGSKDVDLSGFCLSDNPKNALKWKFPKGTKIEAGKFLIVWADEDDAKGNELHANFKLSSKGETLYLSNEKALVDKFEFGKQLTDKSFGRANPTDKQGKKMEPTFGKANR